MDGLQLPVQYVDCPLEIRAAARTGRTLRTLDAARPTGHQPARDGRCNPSPSPCHRSACESADTTPPHNWHGTEPQQYLPHRLQRTRHTAAQSDLTRAQRLRNLRHAFAVADAQRHRITDRHVLLIDDVMTTGATFTAASRCLLQAGARQIDVLCMARTP